MADVTLWHFPISHYAEKARWALDWKGVAHRRVALAASYAPRAWWATGRAKLPILWLDGRAIGNSKDILAVLEDRWPEPPLLPADATLRAEAEAIQDGFDAEVGHPVRTLIVPAIVEEGGARVVEVLMRGMGGGTERLFTWIQPVFRPYYYWRHRIGDESRAAAPAAVIAGFDRIEAALGASGYLAGDAFSVADLTAAALLAPIVRPPGTIWAELGAFPDALERWVEAEVAGRPGFRWVRDVYARHRTP